RFDHHLCDPPAEDPSGRNVVYLAGRMETALVEALRSASIANVCPRWRIAQVRATGSVHLQDITRGGAMKIRALPALSTAAIPRKQSQAWARAIYSTGRVQGIF